MQDSPENRSHDFLALTANVVSGYVANNAIPANELAGLLASVHAALSGLAANGSEAQPKDEVEKPTAAQIKKSITPDALISFEDDKPYKTLRRHLTMRGLTPEAYRAKHGLPVDYPMTCASYSAQRSELARSLGLGQMRKDPSEAAEHDAAVSEAPKRRGRPRKAA